MYEVKIGETPQRPTEEQKLDYCRRVHEAGIRKKIADISRDWGISYNYVSNQLKLFQAEGKLKAVGAQFTMIGGTWILE